MTPHEMATIHAAAFAKSRGWTEGEFTALLENRFTHSIGDSRCFALFQVIAGDAELLTIATHPSFQRQGLALRLMHEWHDQAIDFQATRAFLDVATDNIAAISLYSRCGYRQCGLRKDYYARENGQKVDAFVMECCLPQRQSPVF
ncbi:GNAT family N-acetyltransferase [Ruegeria sp. AD91A]|nr:GNAT family N-acetyltransferase [Ruegeria sp. AD91A]